VNPQHTTSAENLLRRLYRETKGSELSPETVHLYLQESAVEDLANNPVAEASVALRTKKGMIRPRGLNQQRYVKEILGNDINFGIGPAGTGKTYLAVAWRSTRWSASRCAHRAGAPGGRGRREARLPARRPPAQKIDPYLRPLYDALYEMLGFEIRGQAHRAPGAIEIAPLAYMRGRTLNHASSSSTKPEHDAEQMKMFLTRIGFGSKAVITGDVTQVDLPQAARKSGLAQVIEVLKDVPGISFTHFMPKDVVRHPLVQRIVEAYERFEHRDDAPAKDTRRDA
jgi:phosphate starvation-inducible PhoH-like protein